MNRIKRLITYLAISAKSIFGANLQSIFQNAPEGMTISQRVRKNLWDLYNVNAQDKIDYTNTHKDHFSNFNHLDNPEDERYGSVAAQVGLIYEQDGKTPKNAAEVYDMTYEEYSVYKEKVIPISKDRKITEEDIFVGLKLIETETV